MKHVGAEDWAQLFCFVLCSIEYPLFGCVAPNVCSSNAVCRRTINDQFSVKAAH